MASAYIETTVPSYYVANSSRDLVLQARQEVTKLWWDSGCSGCDLFISQETLDEAAKGDVSFAAKRLALINNLPVLEITDRTDELAILLVERRIIPEHVASDALHIAIASVYRMDFLVSWNFKHIVNPRIRHRLRETVASLGERLPVICTPEDLLEDEDN